MGLEPGDRVASRYRIVRLLGSGGTATVYEAEDVARGVPVALKCLLPEAKSSTTSRTRAALFRREFATLAQLSHPLIIRAFEYGTHEGAPYYTMELLSGEDARGLAPMPWQEACCLLSDVASALAFIHSRRLVHRDVTARNVRRTSDGRAKLFDFGALSPMGVPREIVGTAPFVPPESLDGQPLDGRSDLFSLGALAYYLLTGKNAYPASSLAELHSVWNRRVQAPSATVAEIPAVLDALVLSLLDLNPLARPGSAAEVFDRLCALSGSAHADAPEIAQAYLTTPSLVGREDIVVRFRRRMLRAERRRGSSLLIEGEPGSGRSRLLGSLATEARLRGQLVAYASGLEGRRGAFGVVQALVHRLAESEPGLCKDAARGGEVLADLADEREKTPDSEAWPEFATALVTWFLSIATRVTLTIAVDDLEECDEMSLSVLAQLAEAAPTRSLLVLMTSQQASASSSVEHFKSIGGSRLLQPFRASETEELLGSVFGDVPHVEGVARWVHRLADGNAKTALELAQHLVAERVARYEQGAWVLPASLDGLNLPENLGQALDAKIAALSDDARSLAQSLALTQDQDPLLLEEYATLIPGSTPERVFALLDELSAASILVQRDTTYVVANQSIRQTLERSIPGQQRHALHARIAEVYRTPAEQPNLLTAYHLHKAGQSAAAFRLFAGLVTAVQVRGRGLLRSPEGVQFCEEMFEWGRANAAPATDLMLVGRAVLQRASIADAKLARHAPAILEQLERDTGLVYWDEFEHVTDPRDRIRQCVGKAYEERSRVPDAERRLDPILAIQEFALTTAMLAGVYARCQDAASVLRLAAPIDRLRALSPAVDVVADVVSYTANSLQGRACGEIRQRVLEKAAEPVPGIDELSRKSIRLLTLYYQALEESMRGQAVVFERIALLEADAWYEPLAWQVRMLTHLAQGAEKQAEHSRRKRDLLLTSRSDVDRHLETSLAFECTAYVILGDLMAIKRILPTLRERAQRWPGWKPHCLVAEGAYYGLRGNAAKALELSQQALSLVAPGVHATWPLAITRVVRLLVQLGRPSDARALGARALADAEKSQLLPAQFDQLEMAIALAESLLSDKQTATERAARVVRRAEQSATGGIMLIELYAVQAQAAQNTNDTNTFEQASQRIAQICSKVDSPAFAGKLSSLLKLSLGAGFEPLGSSPGILGKRRVVPSSAGAKVRTELELCRGAEERAKRTLGIVLEQARVKQGFLYLAHLQGPTLAASRSDSPPPIRAEEYVIRCLCTHADDESSTDQTSAGFEGRFALVPISLPRGEETLIPGVVLLDCAGAHPKPVADSILSALALALLEAGDAVCVA